MKSATHKAFGRSALNPVRTEIRALIDQAAKARGKTRSEFMIDAARRAAEESLPDQPPSGEGFERLMAAPKPWQN
ncbi:DUF1778 domain-containing protein [Methylomonas rhizoryzae]|uniref:type II toxin-antitoxin system TacA family antitoxin n=1 Tax=Methylomonas sp. HYX-M1 TaxID=3139307 RepID=UPI0012319336